MLLHTVGKFSHKIKPLMQGQSGTVYLYSTIWIKIHKDLHEISSGETIVTLNLKSFQFLVSYLVTWVLIPKSSDLIDCSTSIQPMY
jgi:hypothetical protein